VEGWLFMGKTFALSAGDTAFEDSLATKVTQLHRDVRDQKQEVGCKLRAQQPAERQLKPSSSSGSLS
jgi:hypothetical protein